jgi:hypothetical protein
MSRKPTSLKATSGASAGAGGRFINLQGAHGLMRAPFSPPPLHNVTPD